MKPKAYLYSSVIFTALVTLLILGACVKPTNQAKPTEVAVISPDSQVRRLSPAVFAGESLPLPELTNNLAISLGAGGMVTTNSLGEAEVVIQGCLKLFVFQNGSLQRSTCRRSDVISGLGVCSTGGMTGVLNNCSSLVDIQTPSSSTQTTGTWFTVIYLPEDQLSIVQVYEGEVTVSAAVDPTADRWTEPSVLTGGNLWFTAPGEEAPVINGVTGRQSHPMETWQALRPGLIEKYPGLDTWMETARVRAEEENLSFPEFLAPLEGEVDVQMLGQIWGDDRVQRAMLIGIDWSEIMRSEWFDFDIAPRVQMLDNTIADAREYEYNRDEALALLSETEFWQRAAYINIVVRESNKAAVQFAYRLQSALLDLDIQSELLFVTDPLFEEYRALDPNLDKPNILVSTAGEAFSGE
jgi:hypothetical protein